MESRQMFFDKEGQPITRERWAELLSNDDYRIIEQTHLDKNFVSTVWFGFDYGFGMEDRPLIFETMILPACDYCYRTSTEEEAKEAHRQAVSEIRS